MHGRGRVTFPLHRSHPPGQCHRREGVLKPPPVFLVKNGATFCPPASAATVAILVFRPGQDRHASQRGTSGKLPNSTGKLVGEFVLNVPLENRSNLLSGHKGLPMAVVVSSGQGAAGQQLTLATSVV